MGGGDNPRKRSRAWNASKDRFNEYVNVPSSTDESQTPLKSQSDLEYFVSPFQHHAGALAVSSRPASPLSIVFQLMEIVADKQDLSFVEKVQISEGQITKLFNALASGSARENHGTISTIDFNALAAHASTVIGFYGDKSLLSNIFKRTGLVPPDFVNTMDANNLKSGLYACLNVAEKEKLYLFYWDAREHQVESSRKDVSCNFVRYLVELCQVVYACQDGKIMEEAHMTVATGLPSQKQRTQKAPNIHAQRIKK